MPLGTQQGGVITTTQQRQLPPWLDAAAQQATTGAQNYYGGYQSSPYTMQGLQGLGAQAQNPAGITGYNASLDNFQGLMQGDYLYGGQGFDAAQQAAANRIIPQVQSSFNRSGNLQSTAAQSELTRQLGDSFALQYGQERQNQMQGLGLAPSMFNLAQAPNRSLYEVGQLADNEPESNLDDFIGRLRGVGEVAGYNESSSAPFFENPLAEALGLGATGVGLLQALFGGGGTTGLSAGSGGSLAGSIRDFFGLGGDSSDGGGGGLAGIGSAGAGVLGGANSLGQGVLGQFGLGSPGSGAVPGELGFIDNPAFASGDSATFGNIEGIGGDTAQTVAQQAGNLGGGAASVIGAAGNPFTGAGALSSLGGLSTAGLSSLVPGAASLGGVGAGIPLASAGSAALPSAAALEGFLGGGALGGGAAPITGLAGGATEAAGGLGSLFGPGAGLSAGILGGVAAPFIAQALFGSQSPLLDAAAEQLTTFALESTPVTINGQTYIPDRNAPVAQGYRVQGQPTLAIQPDMEGGYRLQQMPAPETVDFQGQQVALNTQTPNIANAPTALPAALAYGADRTAGAAPAILGPQVNPFPVSSPRWEDFEAQRFNNLRFANQREGR